MADDVTHTLQITEQLDMSEESQVPTTVDTKDRAPTPLGEDLEATREPAGDISNNAETGELKVYLGNDHI